MTPHLRPARPLFGIAIATASLLACGSDSVDSVRSDLVKQVSDVGGITDDQKTCIKDLVAKVPDADIEAIAKASKASTPDLSDPKTAAFVQSVQGCVVTAKALKDQVMAGLPSTLTDEQRTCVSTTLDGLDDATLQAAVGGDASAITDAVTKCITG